jgi:hypothetical protein
MKLMKAKMSSSGTDGLLPQYYIQEEGQVEP